MEIWVLCVFILWNYYNTHLKEKEEMFDCERDLGKKRGVGDILWGVGKSEGSRKHFQVKANKKNQRVGKYHTFIKNWIHFKIKSNQIKRHKNIISRLCFGFYSPPILIFQTDHFVSLFFFPITKILKRWDSLCYFKLNLDTIIQQC